jgi:hypothetical protein
MNVSNERMYVVREGGFLVLRQERYKGALVLGHEHPHDVCAYARSVEEMRSMTDGHWTSVDYTLVEARVVEETK